MQVVLSDDATKQFKRLPQTEQIKVRKKLSLLEKDPSAGKKLSGELSGMRSLRVWPYRVLYDLNEAKKRVDILKIAHRQGVYK